MNMKLYLVGAVILTAVAVGRVGAMDAGDPVFPVDTKDYKARAEFIYNNIQRDLDNGLELNADAYMLRIHTDVGEYAYLDFDLGGIDPTGGDLEFYGGVGFRMLAYKGENFRLSPFIQVHYAPSFILDDVEYDSYLDVDGGLLFAYEIKIDDQLSIVPYAGPALSGVNLSGDQDAGEDNIFGAVAGLSLHMPGQNIFRVEGQFFDQVGFSAAVGIAF